MVRLKGDSGSINPPWEADDDLLEPGYERERETARLIALYGISRGGHSLFSPSSSAGWMNCKGFVLANAEKGDMAGIDAAYGTVAHAVAAVWLTAIRDEGRRVAEHVPKRFLGFQTVENGFAIECDASMLHHIRRYIDWCAEVEILGEVFIEQHVGYSEYMPIPGQGGTADHFVCVPFTLDQYGTVVEPGKLIITDLKMGVGVRVYVERNSQAMLYALGVYLEWNWFYSFKTIIIRICQPRLDIFETWECPVEELLAFAEEAKIAAYAGWREDAPRSPSPKACQWCNDFDCPARSKLLEDLADDAFDDDDVIEGLRSIEYTAGELDEHAMTPLFGDLPKEAEPRFSKRMATPLLAWRYKHRKMYDRFFRQMGEELLLRARAGEKVPGWKIGSGRRSFAWYDPELAALKLADAGLSEAEIFKVEVTSVNRASDALKACEWKPKQIEALLYGFDEDDPDILPLVSVTPGRATLVPADDARADFGDEIDEALDDDEL